MRTNKILISILILILATLACRVNFDEISVTQDVKTGPTVTDQIDIPFMGAPDEDALITINFGAGELNLSSGAETALIEGEVTYNIEDLKPDISIDGQEVKIKTGNLEIDGIPNFKEKVKNTWDLYFGSYPIELTIKAGAYVGEYDFGNLSLVNLHISDGASEVNLDFSESNLTEMQTFRYETGASNISLKNLANANFDTMIFESGAGNFELDFSGQLQRDSNVFIETGLSTMTITVPENMNVKLVVEGGLKNVTSRGSWEQSGNSYSILGDGPTLTIIVEMNAGDLVLRNP